MEPEEGNAPSFLLYQSSVLLLNDTGTEIGATERTRTSTAFRPTAPQAVAATKLRHSRIKV